MKPLADEATRTSWVCPVCGKSMASEGGFKIHLSHNHPGLTPSGAVLDQDTVAEASPIDGNGGSPVDENGAHEVPIVPEPVVAKPAAQRRARTAWRPPEPVVEAEAGLPQAPADDPLLSGTRLSPRSMNGTWQVTITAEGDGDAITPALAEAFRIGLHDTDARVSTTDASRRSCHYSAEVSVRADGALTAVLHGISHFQTAARLARLPAVRIVSVNARDGEHDESFGTT